MATAQLKRLKLSFSETSRFSIINFFGWGEVGRAKKTLVHNIVLHRHSSRSSKGYQLVQASNKIPSALSSVVDAPLWYPVL